MEVTCSLVVALKGSMRLIGAQSGRASSEALQDHVRGDAHKPPQRCVR